MGARGWNLIGRRSDQTLQRAFTALVLMVGLKDLDSLSRKDIFYMNGFGRRVRDRKTGG